MTRPDRPERPSMQDIADRRAELEQQQRALDAKVAAWSADNETLDRKLEQHDQRAAEAAPDPGPVARSAAMAAFVARTRQQAADEQRAHDNATRQANENPMAPVADPLVDWMQARREAKRARRRHPAAILARHHGRPLD